MSEKCVHEWYYRIVDICSWQFFCIRCGEKLSMDKFSDHASDLEKRMAELGKATARIAELEAAQKEALSLLPELEQGHYYCDDCWYSCPKAVDGCCDERQGDECNCGADDYNALLAKIIGLLTPEVQH